MCYVAQNPAADTNCVSRTRRHSEITELPCRLRAMNRLGVLVTIVCAATLAACSSAPAITESSSPDPTIATAPLSTEAPATTAPATTAPATTTPATPTPAVTLAAPTAPVGVVTHETVGPDGRSYRLYVPSNLPAGPVPLFIALHGGTGWGDQFAFTNRVENLAESNGFIVIHPDGIPQPNTRGRVWNGGMCCGIAAREEVDDVAFIEAVIDRVEADHDIDETRVFAFGHSNGGIMSYRLACELSERIVGIGVVAGTLGVDDCAPSRPVSVMHIHGTADQHLPIDGGVGPKSIAAVDFPPPRDGFATLAAADGCTAPTATVEGVVTTQRSAPCEAGTAAVFVTIEGAEHPWPGGTPGSSPNIGDGYAGYDATAELVAFLLAHPRPG
jgi:polyhydroxybutyrate depolymerase